MRTSSSIALLGLTLLGSASLAHADAVSDRVLLTPGGTACGSNQQSFKRTLQRPDGSETIEAGEFVVPTGKYLEITSVEYLPPYAGIWNKGYLQWISIGMRPRTATAGGTSVFRTRYQNATVYAADGDDWAATSEHVTGDAALQVATFPVGPLMGPSARLCLSAPSGFWTYGGQVRVRGRLIASEPTVVGTAPIGSVSE